MSTKFVSKNSNYMVVLKPGVEGSRALGTHAIPGLSVRFQSGVVEVKEQKIIDMLREHPGFGLDFIEVKQDELDPFLDTREEIEPGHVIQSIKYGHAEKAEGTPIKTKLTPAMKKLIEGEAMRMLPDLLKKNPDVLKSIILGIAADMKKAESSKETEPKTTTEEVKKGAGKTTSKEE